MRRWCDAFVRLGAPLVPYDIRRDWLREWRAELAFAESRAARLGTGMPASAIWRAMGAVPHAVWLRWDRWRLDMIWQDLKHSLRSLRRKPGFTFVIVVTLAIGIGGTTAIFGAVNAVLLRPLPYPEPDRLVQVFKTTIRQPDRIGGSVSPPDFADWRRDNTVFSELAAFTTGSYPITGTVEGFLFQRLCSASFIGQAEGFGTGWFFTGEESATATAGGMQLAVRADGGETRKLPWLGRFAHENYIAVPGFPGKTVLIGTDDTSPAGFGTPLLSELYMYVADNAAAVLNGSGKLYVFTSAAVLNAGSLETGHPISGSFVEVTDPASQTPSALQTKADGLNAFKFVRLEDVDYDRRTQRS